MTRASHIALALASVSTVALTAAAQAQPVTNWTGFYVGLNAGAARGHSDVATSIPCAGLVSPPAYFCAGASPGIAAPVAAAGTGSMSRTGFTGGVQAGYNWQINSLVLGAELDVGAFDVGGSRAVSQLTVTGGLAVPGGTVYTVASALDTDWLFTARGRIGWAFGNALLFATGGLAVTNVEASHSYVDTNVNGPATGAWRASETRTGWTIGGGFEWAFARNWSVKAEYLYLDFGSITASGLVTQPGGYVHAISTTTDLTAHIARAGVNFRF